MTPRCFQLSLLQCYQTLIVFLLAGSEVLVQRPTDWSLVLSFLCLVFLCLVFLYDLALLCLSLLCLSLVCLRKTQFAKPMCQQLELLAHGLHKMTFSECLFFTGLHELPRLCSHCLYYVFLRRCISQIPCASNYSLLAHGLHEMNLSECLLAERRLVWFQFNSGCWSTVPWLSARPPSLCHARGSWLAEAARATLDLNN